MTDHMTEEEANDLRKRADFMERRGYRRCDIAACNCGSWHGGHAEDRLREIYEALGGCNGTLPIQEIEKKDARLAELEAENERLRAAAEDLDEGLLRFAFDAGSIGDEINPWGRLADFRRSFGLPPTMSPEQWAAAALAALFGEEDADA